MKKADFLKILSLFFVFLFVGCGGGGSSAGSTKVTDYSFSYSSDMRRINGYFTVSLDDLLPSNSPYTRTVELKNFIADLGKCGKHPLNNDIILSDDSNNFSQKVDINIPLNGQCDEKSFTITADKFVTISSNTHPESWSKTFTIQNNQDTSSILDKIVATPSSFTITTPGEKKTIQVSALNSHNELLERNLTLSIPYGSDSSKDYGSVDKNSITTSSTSVAKFTYSAPSNISDINGTNATINIRDKDSGKIEKVTINFKAANDTNVSEYDINLSMPDKFTVDSEDYIIVNIVDRNNPTEFIDNQNVKDVNVTILNPSMLEFKNGNNPYEYNESNKKSLLVKSKGKAGITVIEVNATVFNGKHDVTIERQFPITILSGPINSISLIYKETKPYSETDPLFTNIYTIHAVDKYGNPANKGERVYVGGVFGITNDANGIELYSDKNGTIKYDESTEKVTFKTDKNLSGVDLITSSNKNVLIVLANDLKYNPDYIGGWDINGMEDDNQTLILDNSGYDIKFTSEENLTYVIGNEKRYDSCINSLAVAHIDSSDGKYVIGDNGRADVELTYDPYFLGKTIYLYVNSAPSDTDTDKRKRVGVARSDILLEDRIKITPETITNEDTENDKNISQTVFITEKDSGKPYEDVNVSLIIGGGCSILNRPTKEITDCDGSVGPYTINVPAGTTCTLSVGVRREH